MEVPPISSNMQREERDISVPTRFRRKSIIIVLLGSLLLVIGGVVILRVVDSKEDLSSQKTSEQNSQGATNEPSLRPVTLPTLPSVGPTDATLVEPAIDATISPSMKPAMILPLVPSMAPTYGVLEPLASAWGSFEILQTYPHDRLAFTQGLELIQGIPQEECFESTGLFGFSSLRRVDIATGQVLQIRTMDSTIFAEGVTYYEDEDKNGRLIQLTWKNGVAFIYDAETFDLLEERIVLSSTTSGEGWGICHVAVDSVFYVTDGTAYLHKWNMTTLELMDKVPVTLRETAESLPEFRDRLNEIEYDYHSNTILSNVLGLDFIVRIDPPTGVVTHRYDLSSLVNVHRGEGVLNGIAVTGTAKEILVTGKNWSYMYRIRLSDG